MFQIKLEGNEIEVNEIKCKSALSPSGLPEFDYSLNPYRGCVHGCAYCYAPNIMRIPRNKWGCFVDVKSNIPIILAKELKTRERGVVGISLTTDPYQPAEEKYKLTRYCLEQLLRFDFPVSIITKSPLVTRDLDILSNFKELEVGLTLTTINETERKLLEPNAPSIESRIMALEQLNRAGITTYAFFGPLYPTLSEYDIKELVEKIRYAGVKKIMADRLNLKPGIWGSLRSALGENAQETEIWKESVMGKGVRYDKLLYSLKMACIKANIAFELQIY
jgi:DNA repair photolyase